MSERQATAVIFDLDGTLVDSEPLYYEATRRLLLRHGVAGYSPRDHEGFVGISTLETVRTLRARHGIGLSEDVLLTEIDALYVELARTSVEAFPEMRAFVEVLHAAGTPIAVASGSSAGAIDAALQHTGLDGYFEVTVSADEVAHGKPAPDVFLETARRLGVPPGACAVIEDSAPGVRAALAAGMRCLAVPPAGTSATDPAYASADRLFPRGHAEFTAKAADAWLHGR